VRKGERAEQEISLNIHKKNLPVLVSSLTLKTVNAGQVDVAGLSKINKSWVLTLYEVKSSSYPSHAQWQRLRKSQEYLSKVLEIDTKLEVKFCQKAEP
jgi:hypothetical protein